MSQLCYGETYDRAGKEFFVMPSTPANCLKMFCEAVVDIYEAELLKLPIEAETAELSDMHGRLGFPMCLGGLDCASWPWDSSPVFQKRSLKGRGKKPCVRMEEAFSDDTAYIWRVWIGSRVRRVTSTF